LFILFLVYKEDIGKNFLSTVNKNITGQVTFSDIGFSPFRHFPNASLKFIDLSLYETKDSVESSNKLPVFEIDETFISVSLIDLLSSQINASEITIEGGSINIVVYPDSQLNFEKAITKVKEKEEFVKDQIIPEKKDEETTGISLKIDDLKIIDLQVNAENQFKKNKVQIKINELSSEFSYIENHIITWIELDTHIDSLIKNNELLFSDEQIILESNLEVDTDSIYVKLEEGSFSIGEAKFLFNGVFDSKNEGFVDISVSGSDEDLSLFTLLLKDEGRKNLKSGDIFFKGSVKGKTFVEFPAIEVSFGLNDVNLINPITKREIKKLNLKGYFNSGKEEDWSNAQLKIDTLYAHLTDGSLKFKGSLHNLKSPEVNVNLFLSADMTGLDKIFNLGPIKNLKGKIENLQVRGKFNYGKSEDLSDSKVEIDTLSADLPGGSVRLSGFVRNFKSPDIDLNVFLSADVTDLDKLYNLGPFTNLKGKINLIDRLKGKYQTGDKKFVNNINNAKISFEDFGLEIPGAMILDKVNGVIRRENENIFFEDLSIISRDTDFLINGKVNNLIYMLFNIEKVITGDLAIKSSVFDLPNFLFFDPSIKRDFNYRILDVDVSVIANTTTIKATVFKSFPEIEFDIKKLDATAENFLPPLKINSGKFKISENLLGFNLKCDNFKTTFLDGDFNFTGEYNTSKFQPFYIKAKTDFKKISPSILFYDETDTVPETMMGKLSGSFFVELQFPLDSTVLKFIKLKDADLVYESNSDTIKTKSLNISFNNVYFNNLINSNPLATLTTTGKISLQEFESNFIVLSNAGDAGIDISIRNGEYQFTSNKVLFFGENAQGKTFWKFKPFTETPTYYMKFDVTKFYAEEMFTTFLEDTLVTGPLSLSMEVNFSGSESEKMLQNLKGQINLSGKDLTFYGMDVDILIEKFKRSQSFNLVDLGAVVLAGPVGIAVTKGSDYAQVLLTNKGESSNITNLVSNWNLVNGEFIIEDAAFSTTKNRIASDGAINFAQDSLDLTIALLNSFGCSVFSQRIYGNMNSPTLGKVKVVGTVLAPVTNLVDDMLGNDCEVFYSGSVAHPK
jgi:hypothetical protein